MRTFAQVFLGYALILVLGCLWRLLPLGRAMPDLVALCAVYLGLTARHRLAPATLGAVVLGYLADLLNGTPLGMHSLLGGIMCMLGHVIHRRLIVRGLPVTLAVSFFTGLVAGLVGLLIRAYTGLLPDRVGAELGLIATIAVTTGLAGPLVFKLCRMIDMRFARTMRDRDAAIEGYYH
jgi:rod shape-determining protein MreD